MRPSSAKTTSKPRYRAVAEAIERRIRRGKLPVGARLPSERKLREEFAVADHTLRRALAILAEGGLITRQHGRGTFVAEAKAASPEAARWASSRAGALLVGLGPTDPDWYDPANWEVRMRRYRGIMEAGFRYGMPIICREVGPGAQDIDALVRELADGGGVLVDFDSQHALSDAAIARLRDADVPVVGMGQHASIVCSGVVIDIRRGATAAMEHLFSLGHRRIALLTGGDNMFIRSREEGYRAALAAQNIPIDERLIIRAPVGLPGPAAEVALQLMDMPQRPTAIFAVNDLRALGVLEAARRRGLRVPQDVAVVGFDDIAPAADSLPPLTTLTNPQYELGQEAVRLLNELKDDPSGEIRIRTLNPELLIRESCGATAR